MPNEKFFDFGKILERDENRHSFIAIKVNQHIAKALCEILVAHKVPFRGDRITIYETERTNRSKRLCVMSMWHDVELVGVEAHLFCQQLRDKST